MSETPLPLNPSDAPDAQPHAPPLVEADATAAACSTAGADMPAEAEDALASPFGLTLPQDAPGHNSPWDGASDEDGVTVPLYRWIVGGLRAGVLLSPQLPSLVRLTHSQWLLGLLGALVVWLAMARLSQPHLVVWSWSAWWSSAWGAVPVVLVALWSVMGGGAARSHTGGAPAVPQAVDAVSSGERGDEADAQQADPLAVLAAQVPWAQAMPHDAAPEQSAAPTPAIPGGTMGWTLLLAWACLLPLAAEHLVTAAALYQPNEGWLERLGYQGFWTLWGAVLVWGLLVVTVLGSRYAHTARRAAVLAAATAMALTWTFSNQPASPWIKAPMPKVAQGAQEGEDEEPARLMLTQEVFRTQQAVLQQALQGVAAQRPGVVDVYGLVFAPYADEGVFLRESTMVRGVLQERFDAQGRVVQLVNHASTTDTLPWATTENLHAAIEHLAAVMDRQEDVLVLYMTSHGAKNFELAAAHYPLTVEEVTPEMLKQWLHASGIRYRVVAISACFSGGWLPVLADEDSLIMTAADATHTSYGCGHLSPLTFFGRAVFDEQLRQTHSFSQAFKQAVPIIAQREVEGKKPDGFSNPQIHVGASIQGVLDGLTQRLDAAQGTTVLPATVPIAPAADAKAILEHDDKPPPKPPVP